MPDTIRTEEELLALFADNNTGNISPQDLRDFVVSAKVDETSVPSLTADRVVTTDSDGALSAAATTTTQLGYLSGVTAPIQTQLDNKADQGELSSLEVVVDQKADSSSLATVATSGAYSDLTGTPSLATVATSGAYSDLTGKPSLATIATSGAYADLTGKPSLATVATSGSYADLTSKPTITANRVMVSDGSGVASASSVTTTTLGYVDPTSSIQTQLDAKAEWPSEFVPTSLAAYDSEDEAHLSWTNTDGSGFYSGIQVFRDDTLVQTIGGTEISWYETGLANGTYSYKIRATFGPFVSPFTDAIDVTIDVVTTTDYTVSYTANYGEWDVDGDDHRVAFDATDSTVQAAIDSAYSTTSSVSLSTDGDTYTYTITVPSGVTFTPNAIAMSRGETLPLGMATAASPSGSYNNAGDEETGWDWGFDLDEANVGWVHIDDTIAPGNGLEGIVITDSSWWPTDDASTLTATVQSHGRPDANADGAPPNRIYTDTPGEAPTVPAISGDLWNVTAVADWSVA